MFQLGTQVNYPHKGLCEVTTIFVRDKDVIYILKQINSTKKLRRFELDRDKALQIGVHIPIDEKDVKEICDILKQKPKNVTFKQREACEKLLEDIYSGDLFKIAEILRDMGNDKRCLSNRQSKRLLKLGEKTLITGLSYAGVENKKDIEAKIKKIMRIQRG